MNEPFMGSLARESFGAATMKMMEKYPAFDMNHPETIPPEQAGEFMALVSERFLKFDRTVLMDFYRRMEKAIRPHSGKAIVTGGEHLLQYRRAHRHRAPDKRPADLRPPRL